ncbi:MAG: HAD family hydrolase [Gammaproteobacteria bacterium]|nr:MAG: HAD family hydrolase [Gammaproteobacteria bacterium]
MSDLSTNNAKYDAVLFDLDGTLLDTAPDFLTCTNRLLADKGMPLLAEDDIRRLVTHGSAGIIRGVFALEQGHPDFEPTRQALLTLYFENLADRTRPFPGIQELLTQLAERQIPWGIVTNKPERYTLAILEQLPLGSPPATVICPDHVQRTKPDPESVLLALQQIGIAPKQAVFIGDHLRDIEAGKRAGTATIAAAYGYLSEGEDPNSWGANHAVDCATQLANLIF